MTDVRVALTTLGWRVNTSDRLRQAVKDFQGMWNLGPALTVDGNPGPKTVAALGVSVARRAQGLPDISAHFSAVEFRCDCDKNGGPWADCRRIWTPRSTVQMAEKFRVLVGPYSFDRACRCPTENKRVGGASASQHLYGRGLDIPIFTVTVTQVRAALGTVGIGTYTGNGRLYVRHVDNRGSWAQWDYGDLKTVPLKPRPDLANTTPAAPQEDDMPLNDADKAFIVEAVKNQVKVALVEMNARNTPIDRNAGSAFWTLCRDAATPTNAAIAELGAGLGPAVQKSVAAALAADYNASVTLTPKES